MKKVCQLLILGGIFTTFQLSAQPVLDSIADYSIGNTRSYVLLEGNPIDELDTGADVTWSFDALGPIEDTILQKIVEPSQSAHGGNYQNADYAEVYSNDYETYVERLGDTNQMVGNYNANLGVEITYTDPFPLLKRPFAYNDTVADSGRRKYEIPGFGMTYEGKGYSRTEAIGWGTLILPYDTFEQIVLIKNHQKWTDKEDETTVGSETYNEITSYRWYDPDSAQYLLAIDSFMINNPFLGEGEDSTIVNVQYYTLDTANTTGIKEAGLNIHQNKINCFVANRALKVVSDAEGKTELDLALYNMAGRKVKDFKQFSISSGEHRSLVLNGLNQGVYLIKGRFKSEDVNTYQPYVKKVVVSE